MADTIELNLIRSIGSSGGRVTLLVRNIVSVVEDDPTMRGRTLVTDVVGNTHSVTNEYESVLKAIEFAGD